MPDMPGSMYISTAFKFGELCFQLHVRRFEMDMNIILTLHLNPVAS